MRAPALRAAILCLTLLAATVLALHAMGRPPICTCGHVALWYGSPKGPETSQHLLDPYSFTHVTHGFLLHGLVWLWSRLRGGPLAAGQGLLLATAIEAAWEIVENTPWIIARYRAETAALGYHGDSIVNSLADILAMMAGYAAAAHLPVVVTVAAALIMEVALALLIRDNLLLNVLMLVAPIARIKAWQAGS